MKKKTPKKKLKKKHFFFILAFFSFITFATTYSYLELFAQALHTIKTKHFKSPSPEKLIAHAIKGMVLNLDPYSQVLTSKDLRELQKYSQGEYFGLGLEVERKDSFILVLSVLKDSPAHKIGLLPGDKILKLNEQSTKYMTVLDFRNFFKKKTSFKLFFLRGNKSFTRRIQPQYLKIQFNRFQEFEKGIFYLRIYIFSNKTVFDISSYFKHKKIKALLIDVRNNPGGVFDQSIKVADLFLRKGVIASYKIKSEKEKRLFKAHQAPYLGDFPLVILANEFSASSSEVFVAALKENKRAVVVGRTTFGKGLLQSIFPLKKDYILKLSVGEYQTPLENLINEKGVQPDIVLSNPLSSFKEFEDPIEDPEISQALQVLKNLISQ
ncbi:MAG: PDZ domain-containing protein [Bdellovibrionales bacterium]|nr:PDZ domain-containing protein [Bdellovibrionales bacterium]